MTNASATKVFGVEITCRNGEVLRGTEHDQILLINGEEYAPRAAIFRSKLSLKGDLEIGDGEFSGSFSKNFIEVSAIQKGIFDGAQVKLVEIDWKESRISRLLFEGFISSIDVDDFQVKFSFMTIEYKLHQSKGRAFHHQCDAQLFDERCRVVEKQEDRLSARLKYADTEWIYLQCISPEIATDFENGRIIIDNRAHLILSVKPFEDGLAVKISTHDEIDVKGQNAELIIGCDKMFSSCVKRFNNGQNFCGFPHIPRQDQIYKIHR